MRCLRLLATVLLASASCGRSEVYAPAGTAGMTPDGGPCAFDATVVGDLFGQTVPVAGGAALPTGRYRVTYVDGCMKYGTAGHDWTVNGTAAGPYTFWIVDGARQQLVVPPGSVGFVTGQGGFSTFGECVKANLTLAPLEFDFSGGPLALFLEDDPYGDNIAGESGRNPTWRLRSASCP